MQADSHQLHIRPTCKVNRCEPISRMKTCLELTVGLTASLQRGVMVTEGFFSAKVLKYHCALMPSHRWDLQLSEPLTHVSFRRESEEWSKFLSPRANSRFSQLVMHFSSVAFEMRAQLLWAFRGSSIPVSSEWGSRLS